jgi:hypothetical protein
MPRLTGAPMKRPLIAILLSAAAVWAASPSHATPSTARLLGVSGKVLINSGNGFKAAAPDAILSLGSDVFVDENSSATIHFDTGNCNVLLAAGSVTRISDASMCQQAMTFEPLPNGLRGVIDDVVITPVNGYAAPPPPPSVGAGFLSPYAIAGGFLAIGATTIAYTVLVHDDPVPVTVP